MNKVDKFRIGEIIREVALSEKVDESSLRAEVIDGTVLIFYMNRPLTFYTI